MKATELRIGNITYFISGKDGSRCVHSIIVSDLVSIELGKKIFKPIPLTKEWLLKFGFDKINNLIIDSFELKPKTMIGNNILSVTVQNGNQYIYLKTFDTDDTKLRPSDLVCLRNSDTHGRFYIHQLQNLYHALTGNELTISE